MLIVGGHQIQIILTWKKNEKKKLTVTLCQINMKETINDKKSHLTSRIPFEFHDFESLHVLANDYMIYANNRLHLIDWVTIAREKCVLFGIKYEILVHYCEAVNHGVNRGKALKFFTIYKCKIFHETVKKIIESSVFTWCQIRSVRHRAEPIG